MVICRSILARECLKLERSGHLKRIQVPSYAPEAAKALKRVAAALQREIASWKPSSSGWFLCLGTRLLPVFVCQMPKCRGFELQTDALK